MKKSVVILFLLIAVGACTVNNTNMALIKGGTFLMGAPANEKDYFVIEAIRHQVTVSSFFMGKYEVTQKEYQEIMGENPSRFQGDNLPVECVNWYDAIEYCNKRSQKEGLTLAYAIDKNQKDPNNKIYWDDDDVKWTVTWNRSANGYRLPTEAEWEYACRAGTTTRYNTGDSITTSQANYYGDEFNKFDPPKKTTMPVGSFAPNDWGLYDMHGNVFEWCWDWIGDYSSEAQIDPVGAVSGYDRIARGGCAISLTEHVRSANRAGDRPSSRVSQTGFRVVRNALLGNRDQGTGFLQFRDDRQKLSGSNDKRFFRKMPDIACY